MRWKDFFHLKADPRARKAAGWALARLQVIAQGIGAGKVAIDADLALAGNGGS